MNIYKIFLIAVLVLHVTSCEETKTTSAEVSFIGIVDIANTTKDGIYISGYVVEMDDQAIRSFNGKKVKITGKAIIVKGLNKEDEVIKQGRSQDVIHVKSSKIEISED